MSHAGHFVLNPLCLKPIRTKLCQFVVRHNLYDVEGWGRFQRLPCVKCTFSIHFQKRTVYACCTFSCVDKTAFHTLTFDTANCSCRVHVWLDAFYSFVCSYDTWMFWAEINPFPLIYSFFFARHGWYSKEPTTHTRTYWIFCWQFLECTT